MTSICSLTIDPGTGDMVSDPQLPSMLISRCMDVLLKLSSHERDFMRVVVEIVQNIREDSTNTSKADDSDESDDNEEEEDLDLDTATAEEIAADQKKRRERSAKKIQNQQLDPEKKDTYLRCLALVRALLERVAGVCIKYKQAVRSIGILLMMPINSLCKIMRRYWA